jgi:ribose transport system ATP-binding protein
MRQDRPRSLAGDEREGRGRAEPPALQLALANVTVDYVGVRALDGVGFSLHPGEVQALVGPNGSGKSTLIKVLSGVESPAPGGRLTVGGREMSLALDPARSRALGMRFMHQDLALVEELPVHDNIFLGNHFPSRGPALSRGELISRAGQALEAVGLEIDPRTPVSGLRESQRALVALARALIDLPEPGYLVLDEPTAAMNATEAEALFEKISELVGGGAVGVLFVSHRLEEIYEIADRITVLREGSVLLDAPIAEVRRERLLSLLTGERARSAESARGAVRAQEAGDEGTALELSGVRGAVVRDLTLRLGRGEILGVTGVEGCGKEELVDLLTGGSRPLAGTISVSGRARAIRSTRDALAAGIGHVPANRVEEGGIGELTVRENVTLPRVREFWRHGQIDLGAERSAVDELIRAYDVVPADSERRFATLSGGNQQKALLAKWLSTKARVLILHEPTAGIDIPSRAAIYGQLRDAAALGRAVLFVSSDFDELPLVCDRIAVLLDGRLSAILPGPESTKEQVVRASFELAGEPVGAGSGEHQGSA